MAIERLRISTSGAHEVPPLLPGQMTLRRDSVHVWMIPLPSDEGDTNETSVLSSDEIIRARRFRFAEDRAHYVCAHSSLRRILGAYLVADPSLLTFASAACGKPYLSGAYAGATLRFNLSHTRGLALCAIGLEREIGADVEAVTRSVDVDAVARDSFSPAEHNALLRLAPEERRAAFFRVWTRKEAYVKAVGEGLGCDTRGFTVSLLDGDMDALVSSSLKPEDVSSWRVQSVDCPHGYSGAVAAAGRDWSTKIAIWDLRQAR